MKIEHLIYLIFLVFGLTGPPLAVLFNEGGVYYNQLVAVAGIDSVYRAYFWLLYSFIIFYILFNIFLKKRLSTYIEKPLQQLSEKKIKKIWFFSIFTALLIASILFMQNNFSHPLLQRDFESLVENYYLVRAEVSRNINMNLFNTGLHVFIALSLITSLFILGNPLLSVISIVVLLFFVSFNLAKSPVADVILQLTFFYLLINRKSWKPVFLLLIALLIMAILFALTNNIQSFHIIGQAVISRIFIGAFSDFPVYLELFKDNPVSPLSLLPPYIQSLSGNCITPPSKRVSKFYVEKKLTEVPGNANTFFPASAFACFGTAGLIISPFIVFINFAFIIFLFTQLKKTLLNTFIFSYLLYRLSGGLIGDIGYYLFSGIQILLILFISYLILRRMIIVSNLKNRESGFVYPGTI